MQDVGLGNMAYSLLSRITSENVAERFGISREKQDAFALASQQK